MKFDEIKIVTDFPEVGNNYVLYAKKGEDNIFSFKYFENGEWKSLPTAPVPFPMPEDPSAVGTYTLKATVTAEGVTYSWVADTAVSG